ncbi:unnamed protein product [Rangifer tarandus platyrhynchus]|uniref:Uncharacterized protein n=1 Tax=Rangifer tarandus platyrhynchus TaxID=3082113 RepID=A0AC59Z1Q5_RANTA
MTPKCLGVRGSAVYTHTLTVFQGPRPFHTAFDSVCERVSFALARLLGGRAGRRRRAAALSARRSCRCRESGSLTALGLDQQSVAGALVETGIEGGPRGRERAVHPPEQPRLSNLFSGCQLSY